MAKAVRKIVKASAFLAAMLKLVEAGWCKGPLATDSRGRRVDPWDPRACRFCVSGADSRVRSDARVSARAHGRAWRFLNEVRNTVPAMAEVDIITHERSRTTKKQVVAYLRKARALALKAGA